MEKEIARLREAELSVASSANSLGSNPGELDILVLVHFKREECFIPHRVDQEWASFRERLIRIFHLKRSDWELRERKKDTDTDCEGKWVVIEPPFHKIGEEMEYPVVLKKEKAKVPGPNDMDWLHRNSLPPARTG